jgi:hypothetical protein
MYASARQDTSEKDGPEKPSFICSLIRDQQLHYPVDRCQGFAPQHVVVVAKNREYKSPPLLCLTVT